MWIFKLFFVTNALSHLLHLTRSQISECMFLWRFRSLLEENAISQCSYWWSLIFSWTLLNMTFAENNFLFFQLSRSRFGDWTSTSHFTKSLEFLLELTECSERNRWSHFPQANLKEEWAIFWWFFWSDSHVNFSSQSLKSQAMFLDTSFELFDTSVGGWNAPVSKPKCSIPMWSLINSWSKISSQKGQIFFHACFFGWLFGWLSKTNWP